jgi:hypothetical protein
MGDVTAPLRLPKSKSNMPSFSLNDIVNMYVGLTVPDPIMFSISHEYLDRPNIYPRQSTLLKVIFLRVDLMTDYDFEVIKEWTDSFRNTGNNGIQVDIYQRIEMLRAEGRKWFREVLLVMGRRGGKGHISAQAMAYVLWNYMAKGDPQDFYGVDRSKRLTALIFAGKREQAKANLWKDLVNVITEAPCFTRYISKFQAESLTIFAPQDFAKIKKMADRGIVSDVDPATFEVLPKESTLMAGRGPASFCLDPSTLVLTTDLRWVPIGEVQSGDHLIGLDEFPTGQRKMRDAEVSAVWRTFKPALRITMVDGTEVICSEDHQWLTRDMGKGAATKWRKAKGLKIGNHIKHLVDPWEEDRSWEGGYLAGVFDGEGCVSGWSGRAGKSVFFTQNEGPVLDQTLSMLKDKGFDPVRYSHLNRPAQQWEMSGTSAMAFLGSVRPSRLMTKAREVWEGVAPRGGRTPSGRERQESYKTILSIEVLPAQELVDITTSTGTFIANGLVSHNCQGYDEMAHVVNSGANRAAEEVYAAATPSLDQFGKDGFIIEPSSPWQMMGQFFVNYQQSLAFDETGTPVRPEMLMIQLASWDIYLDWEIAHEIPIFPPCYNYETFEHAADCKHSDPLNGRQYEPGELLPTLYYQRLKGAIQTYDDQMVRLKMSNPETFAVERESKFATAIDAYLNAEKVEAMFLEWQGRVLQMQTKGNLIYTYKAHGDPSKSNANFGFAIAHPEYDEEGTVHCVFDLIHHWDPADFPDHIVDYEEIEDWIWKKIVAFVPEEVTFDQWNSASMIQRMQKKVREANFPKTVQVYEETATAAHNWKRAENFKTALNMGWIHAPYYEQAELELKFLQEKNGKVIKPEIGPVQTKDVADCIMECVFHIVGEQVNSFMAGDLSRMQPRGAMMGGVAPFPGMSTGEESNDPLQMMAGFARSRSFGRESGYGMAPGRRAALRGGPKRRGFRF